MCENIFQFFLILIDLFLATWSIARCVDKLFSDELGLFEED